MPKIVAAKVTALREREGWTMATLADQLDVSVRTVTNLEDPEYDGVSIDNLNKLAELFGKRPEFFLPGYTEQPMVRVTFEMSLPFEEYDSDIHGDKLLQILASLLNMKNTNMSIVGAERGSTKITVEMPQGVAESLKLALKDIDYSRIAIDRQYASRQGVIADPSLIDILKELQISDDEESAQKIILVTRVTFESEEILDPNLWLRIG